jgi:hypothetical protein
VENITLKIFKENTEDCPWGKVVCLKIEINVIHKRK